MEKKDGQPADGKMGAEVKKGVDLDKILIEDIGQFGWFQLRTMVLTAIAVIFSGFAGSEFVFTAARINTRCLIPECESAEQPAEFNPSWILNAVPASGSTFDGCSRFANISVNVANITDAASCPASLFDTNNIADCEEFVYENTNTVVHTFGLACQEWKRSFIGTASTFGTFVALAITGYSSDRWGRRTALCVCATFRGTIGVARSFVNTYVGFTMLEFLEGALGAGTFSSAYILVVELLGPSLRVAGGTSMNTWFSVGGIFVGLVASAIHEWRLLTRVVYIPMLISSLSLWIVPESVRWYLSKGRYQEAEAVLKTAARFNGKNLSDETLKSLRESVEQEKRKNAEVAKKPNEPWLIVQVFRHKQILIRCIIAPVWWITYTFVYFGLSYNAVNISGNSYLNFVAVTAIEIPGYWTAMLLVGKIGRKPVLICAYWICAACQMAYVFMPDGYYGVSLAVYLIGKFAIAVVTTALYAYTAELFPTRNRHSLLGFSSMIGRVGSMLAALTPAMADSTFDELPFVLFGTMAFISGCLIFITPETLGTQFPDTMEEAENIKKIDSK